jgi:hypothetical protein
VEQARPEYPLMLLINGRALNRVVIDQHYREGHVESISDELILQLVKELDGQTYPIELIRGEFEYFTVEPVILAEKPYRLVLMLCMTDDYLGVVNAFRVNE